MVKLKVEKDRMWFSFDQDTNNVSICGERVGNILYANKDRLTEEMKDAIRKHNSSNQEPYIQTE